MAPRRATFTALDGVGGSWQHFVAPRTATFVEKGERFVNIRREERLQGLDERLDVLEALDPLAELHQFGLSRRDAATAMAPRRATLWRKTRS